MAHLTGMKQSIIKLHILLTKNMLKWEKMSNDYNPSENMKNNGLIISLGYFLTVLAILSAFLGYYMKIWIIATILLLSICVLYVIWQRLLRKRKGNVQVNFHYRIANYLFILICVLISILGIICNI